MNELTGVHRCIRCLAEVAADAYYENDCACDDCAEIMTAAVPPKVVSAGPRNPLELMNQLYAMARDFSPGRGDEDAAIRE